MSAKSSSSTPARTAAAYRAQEAVSLLAEVAATGMQPLSFEQYLSGWMLGMSNPREVFRKCRELARENSYMQPVVGTRQVFYGAGMRVLGSDEFVKAAGKATLERLARDAWREYLACDNAVAVWMRPARPRDIPLVTIFDCDQVEYSNAFGVEVLKVNFAARKLTAEERRRFGDRLAKAIEGGRSVTLNERNGECFQVLSRAKLGHGLAVPRMKASFFDLAIFDLLRQGDHNGAWARKNLLRHAKKGHEVKYGPASGSPAFFFTKAFGEKMKKKFAGMNGFSDFVSNWDLTMEYVYLNPDFFSRETLETTLERLDRWAGPAGALLRRGEEGRSNPHLMPIFKAQGDEERGLMAGFLESIFNHETFGAHDPVKVTFDDTVWLNGEQLQKWVGWAQGAGLMSPQTARRLIRLDNDEESRLMAEAMAHPEYYTPPFEAKQGLLRDEGGRPKGKEEEVEN